MAEAESFGAEPARVAGLAVDVLVGPVAGVCRVQRTFAVPAVEARLVPHLSDTESSNGQPFSQTPPHRVGAIELLKNKRLLVRASRQSWYYFSLS